MKKLCWIGFGVVLFALVVLSCISVYAYEGYVIDGVPGNGSYFEEHLTGTGSTWANTASSGYYLEGSYGRNLNGANTGSATWKTNVPEAGFYKVEYVHVKATLTHEVVVKHNNKEETVTIPGGGSTSVWFELGTFYFNGNETEAVVAQRTTAGSGANFRVDAVRLTPVDYIIDGVPGNGSYFEEHLTGTGSTWTNTASAGYYLAGSFGRNMSGANTGSATWKTNVPEAGFYKVEYVHVKSTLAHAVVIKHNNKEESVDIAKGGSTSEWLDLGTFYFSGGETEAVVAQRTTAGSGANFRVDAIRLTPVAAENPGPYTSQRIDAVSTNMHGSWTATTTFPNSSGELGKSFYTSTENDYAEYQTNLVPGWYDLYFWNLVYSTNQNPMKMTATVHANHKTRAGITLPVNTTSGDREGRWDKIGTYYFSGDEGEYVRLVSTGGAYARVADIRLEQNLNYEAPEFLTTENLIFAYTPGKKYEAISGYFDIYVKGKSGDCAQLQFTCNGSPSVSRVLTFDESWQHVGNIKAEEFDVLELKQIVLKGETGTESIRFEYVEPSVLAVEDVELFNLSTGEERLDLQAGNYRVTAKVCPENTDEVLMMLALYEDNELKKTASAYKNNLTAGTAELFATIPITEVSDDTVLKVLFWESFKSIKPLVKETIFNAEPKNKTAPYYILPENFDSNGTWTISGDDGSLSGKTLMGKTSAGITEDATVTLNVQKSGNYHLWVRSKNFGSASNPTARYFNLKINGDAVEKTFGQKGEDGYFWEDAGEIYLQQGENMISLTDSSCYYARFDGIYITKSDEIPTDSYDALVSQSTVVVPYIEEMSEDAMMLDFDISRDFSGGNIVVVSKNNNEVHLKPDFSDTDRTDWFYWNFKADSDTARTVTFKFDGVLSYILNSTGVLCSTDDGKTWDYLTDYKGSKKEFSYTFEAGEQAWFSVTLPYVKKDLDAYIETIQDNDRVEITTLCQSEEGRDVPLIIAGNQNAEKSVVFTSRHHSCEATASYALEGVIDYLLTQADESVLDDYCFYIVPMMDVDGVENGHQGKGKLPQDHNRDYVKKHWASVRAIQELTADKNVELFLDFHCPYVVDEKAYFYYDSCYEADINALSELLIEATAEDEIVYDATKNQMQGSADGNNAKGYFTINKEPRISATFEIPYTGGEVEYTPTNLRVLGNKTMMSLIGFLYSE